MTNSDVHANYLLSDRDFNKRIDDESSSTNQDINK